MTAGEVTPGELRSLAGSLRGLAFTLTSPGAADRLRVVRDRLAQLLDGLAARVEEADAPLLIVVGGGTGAGKSTTVNSLVGRAVATTGVVRPTTRAPMLVCHPADRDVIDVARLLPEPPGADGPAGAVDAAGTAGELEVATSGQLPRGLALLDTPDVDSVETANHRLAEAALDTADVWLWLATARTYADEVGMLHLRQAQKRQAVTAVVITQVPDADRAEVLDDVDRLLAEEGVTPKVRLTIPFAATDDGRVPEDGVAAVRDWLASLAPDDARRRVRAQALGGLRHALPGELAPLLEAARVEVTTARELRAAVTDAYAPVTDRLGDEIRDGIPVRSEVLRRWRDLVGVSDVAAPVRSVAGQLRGLVGRATGRPVRRGTDAEEPRAVEVEVTGAVTDVLTRVLEEADRAARWAWEDDPVGRRLLAADRAASGAGPGGGRDDGPGGGRGDAPAERDGTERRDAPAARAGSDRRDARAIRVRAAVEAWTDHLAAQIDEVAPERQSRARWYSGGLNAVATSALLVVFVSTGGLTGAEVGIAAVASATSQALLVRLFGAQNLSRLLDELERDLRERTVELAAADRRPYDRALADAAVDGDRLAAVERLVARLGRDER